jgi:hypothetical protein
MNTLNDAEPNFYWAKVREAREYWRETRCPLAEVRVRFLPQIEALEGFK